VESGLARWNVRSVKEITEIDGVSDRYVSQMLKLAFLSPRIIRRIFKGDMPHDLTLGKLKAKILLDWDDQNKLFAKGTV